MFEFKKYFQTVSYLAYPFMVLSLFYAYKPLFNNFETVLADYNSGLVWMGLAISFSTLQDTTKVQNKMSLRVWQNPKFAKAFIYTFTIFTVFLFGFAIFGFFFTTSKILSEFAFGLIVLAISMLGLLKAMIEMAENHMVKE